MRLFIAANLPDNLKDVIVGNQKLVQEICGGNAVNPDQLHITLAFLGEVEESKKGAAEMVLCRASAMQIPIVADLAPLGFFGDTQDALIWQGVETKGQLDSLASDLRDLLTQKGISYDDKPFKAHVSLLKHAQAAQIDATQLTEARGIISAITLYQSELTESGPVYTPLFTSQF